MSLYSDVAELFQRLPAIEKTLALLAEQQNRIERRLVDLLENRGPAARLEITAVGTAFKRPQPL